MTGSKLHAKPAPIKVAAGVVVAANERMDVWQPGYVIVRDGRIAEAGPGTGPPGEFQEDIHEPFAILMPGLVNAHAHSPSNLLKGSWSQLPLEIWRQHQRAGWREYSDEAIYVSAQLGIAEMIRTGCTSVLDHFYSGSSSPHMGALHALSAMTDAGMRGGIALSLSDRAYEATVGIDREGASEAVREEMTRISRLEEAQTLNDFVDFAKAVRRRTDLVVPIIGPSAPHRCSDALLVQALQLAIELDTPLHAHVCETKGQFLQGRKLFGCTVVEHLDSLGLLNERLAMAHCVWLTDADVERVARKAALAIHNPASNGKLGSGRMRFDELVRRGARVGLATDGATSNDNQNMFEAMRLAGLWHNRNDRDYRDWPAPKEILRAATSGNAQALGLAGKLGTLESGRLADLVLLTTDSPHFVPLNDAITQLIYCENGTSVTDVMIDGRWVLRNRKLLTIDETALYRRARAVRAEMDPRVQEQYRRTAPLEPPLREAYLRTGQAPWNQ
jgi:cytosine/adenosine deaminase-related metal-dependent hydrolase